MDHVEIVRTIPGVAITLVGFIGIVFALGHRPGRGWTSSEWIQVYAMTAAPMTAFYCSFAPDLFATLVESPEQVWRLSNGTLGTLHLLNIIPFILRAGEIRTTVGQRILAVIGVSLILAHFLSAFGVLPWVEFIFIIGLLQPLYVGMHNFVLMLLGSVAEETS